MAGPLATYNADVLRQHCPTCGKPPPERCKGTSGTRPTHAHQARLAAAGYRWNRKTTELEKLDDPATT